MLRIFPSPRAFHLFLHASHIFLHMSTYLFYIFFKFHCLYRGRDLEIFPSPKAYTEGESSGFLRVLIFGRGRGLAKSYYRGWSELMGLFPNGNFPECDVINPGSGLAKKDVYVSYKPGGETWNMSKYLYKFRNLYSVAYLKYEMRWDLSALVKFSQEINNYDIDL